MNCIIIPETSKSPRKMSVVQKLDSIKDIVPLFAEIF